MVYLSHLYMTTRKSIPLTMWTFVGKVMSLLFHMLSGFVTAFLPRRKYLLFSCLQPLSTVILEPKKTKCGTISTFPPSVCHEVMWLYVMIFFWMLIFKAALSPSSSGSLALLHFLPLEWYHLHIWGCWYFSQQSWFHLVIHPVQPLPWCILNRS